MASIVFVAFMLCLFLYSWKEARRFRREGGIRRQGKPKVDELTLPSERALFELLAQRAGQKGKGEQDDG